MGDKITQTTAMLPLCDQDYGSMFPKELLIEHAGDTRPQTAYVCESDGCGRCYHETLGYFDLIFRKPLIDTPRMICQGDAHAMYLEIVSAEHDEVWRCPYCGEVAKV